MTAWSEKPAGAVPLHQRHIDQTQAHQRESGDAKSRPDDDAPLEYVARSSPHIPECGKLRGRGGTTALALCSGVLSSGASSPRRGS